MTQLLTSSILFERMVSRLRLRHLKLLVAIDECGSLGGAASYVGMSQPAATQMIRELEELLGMRLYERQTRGVVPNKGARSLADHSRFVLAHMQQAADGINALSVGSMEPVNVGATPAAIFGLLEPRIDTWKAKLAAPVCIFEDGPERVLTMLNSGIVQMAFVRNSSDYAQKQFTFLPLVADEIIVVAAPSFQWHAGPTQLQELSSFHWSFAPAMYSSGQAFEDACGKAGFVPKRAPIQSIAAGLICRVVESKDALAAVPRSIAFPLMCQGRLQQIIIDPPISIPDLGVMYREGSLSSSSELLLHVLCEDLGIKR